MDRPCWKRSFHLPSRETAVFCQSLEMSPIKSQNCMEHKWPIKSRPTTKCTYHKINGLSLNNNAQCPWNDPQPTFFSRVSRRQIGGLRRWLNLQLRLLNVLPLRGHQINEQKKNTGKRRWHFPVARKALFQIFLFFYPISLYTRRESQIGLSFRLIWDKLVLRIDNVKDTSPHILY